LQQLDWEKAARLAVEFSNEDSTALKYIALPALVHL
jgi:hypothetical protein